MFNKLSLLLCLLSILILSSCATLQDAGRSFRDIKRLEYRLAGVVPGRLAGIDLAHVANPSKLGIKDGLKLTQAFALRRFPLDFVLKLEAKNPPSTSGSEKGLTLIQSVKWKLLIDEKETVSGEIGGPIRIPAAGESAIIPISMGVDLYAFFGDKGYKEVLDLALTIAGENASTSRLALLISPVLSIAGVPVPYPGYIRVIDKRFNS